MPRSEGDYELLPAYPRADDRCTTSDPTWLFAYKRRELYVFVVSVAVNALAILWLVSDSHSQANSVHWRGARPLYNPLETAISYHGQVAPSLRDRSKYFGPPDANVDKAWADLYRDTVSVVSPTEASKFANQTFHYPAPDTYRSIMTVDVFHVLHCLNIVRMWAWPERYPFILDERHQVAAGLPFDHVDHCINAVRESIMCNAEITPNVWQVPQGSNMSQIRFNTVHTCRNFTAIQEWAKLRNTEHIPGLTVDPLEGISHPLVSYDLTGFNG